jgi:hypothetical protein
MTGFFQRFRKSSHAVAEDVTIMHVGGEQVALRHLEEIDRLLDELQHADDEHPDVGISDADEWSLSAFADGAVLFENLEDDVEMIVFDQPRAVVVELFTLLATGRVAELRSALPWQPRQPGQ